VLDIADVLLLILFGAVGSFLSGFLGVGGGTIYVPVIDLFLTKMGLQNTELVKAILANSLFVIIFSGIISSYQHYKINNFNIKLVLLTALPGMFSAFVVTYLIKSGSWYSKAGFNYVFAAMLLFIILRMFLAKPKNDVDNTNIQWKYFSITGFFAGIITALSGLGGGVVMTPVFTDWLKINIKKAAGISNGVIPFFAIAVGILNLTNKQAVQIHSWQFGYVVFPIVVPIIISSLFFSGLGVKVAQKVSKKTIRITFAILSTIIFLKVLYEILYH
jgi:uncharacterized membrane protein YfcA